MKSLPTQSFCVLFFFAAPVIRRTWLDSETLFKPKSFFFFAFNNLTVLGKPGKENLQVCVFSCCKWQTLQRKHTQYPTTIVFLKQIESQKDSGKLAFQEDPPNKLCIPQLSNFDLRPQVQPDSWIKNMNIYAHLWIHDA